MTCEHKRIKCVNCEFFCLDCGAKVDPLWVANAETGGKAAATEPPKRKTRKGATKA